MSIIIIFYNKFKYLYDSNYLLLKDKYPNNDDKENSTNAKTDGIMLSAMAYKIILLISLEILVKKQ